MQVAATEAPWTYERYCQLPDDGQRYEVIDGALYVTPAPRLRHQTVSRRLQDKLYDLEKRGEGWVFDAPTDLLMPGCTPVQPDLLYLGPHQREALQENFVQGVPELIVEILSSSSVRRDRVVKLNRYASSGVLHYWLLDPAACTVECFQLDGEHYRLVQALEGQGTFEHRGILFNLEEIFAPTAG
jgi:Uma2 family endonuclease